MDNQEFERHSVLGWVLHLDHKAANDAREALRKLEC
jgi:hypothetical protein